MAGVYYRFKWRIKIFDKLVIKMTKPKKYHLFKMIHIKSFISPGFLYLVAFTCSAASKTYVVPPTTRTSSNVPYISDAAMVKCVSLYNNAKWLAEELDKTVVDQYSQESVDRYNEKVNKHRQMSQIFNRDCAGKQSESAYKAAQALNKASKK
jgi:hypothetical protein